LRPVREVLLLRASAKLALGFGLFLAVAELARNWGNWQWWPFWLVDFVASGLLVAGAISVLRRSPRGPVLVAGAWGFASAMFYMSFWSHVESFAQPAEGNLSQGPLTVIIGVMWALTLLGLALAVAARPEREPRR
jgi:hypothetical protein